MQTGSVPPHSPSRDATKKRAERFAPKRFETRRFVRGALTVVALCGALLAIWPLAQNGWTRWQQATLQRSWQQAAQNAKEQNANAQTTKAKTTKAHALKASSRALSSTRTAKPAWIPTRLIIDDIGLDAVVMSSDDDSSLRAGPGHDPHSALPGQRGNCVIAAHRNIFGSYFYRLDELLPGAKIVLRTPTQRFHYTVVQTFQVGDTDAAAVRATAPDAPPVLTLYTCTIPRTSNRIVVTAQRVEEPNAP